MRDDDKIDEKLVGKYVLANQFDTWVRSLKNRMKLKKGEEGRITKKEFDKLNTREEWDKWRTGEGVGITPPKRRRHKEKTTQVEVIHDTELFERLRKRLILDTWRQHNISTQKKELLNSNKDY